MKEEDPYTRVRKDPASADLRSHFSMFSDDYRPSMGNKFQDIIRSEKPARFEEGISDYTGRFNGTEKRQRKNSIGTTRASKRPILRIPSWKLRLGMETNEPGYPKEYTAQYKSPEYGDMSIEREDTSLSTEFFETPWRLTINGEKENFATYIEAADKAREYMEQRRTRNGTEIKSKQEVHKMDEENIIAVYPAIEILQDNSRQTEAGFGRGWFGQELRHSIARKFGAAEKNIVPKKYQHKIWTISAGTSFNITGIKDKQVFDMNKLQYALTGKKSAKPPEVVLFKIPASKKTISIFKNGTAKLFGAKSEAEVRAGFDALYLKLKKKRLIK